MSHDEFTGQRLGTAHRQRRALLTAGVVGAAMMAAGVPAALWLRRGTGERPPDLGNLPPPSPQPPAVGGNLRVPMRLRPTWLPEGLAEAWREVQIGDSVSQGRLWASAEFIRASIEGSLERAGQAPRISLELRRPVAPVWPSPWPSESPPPTEPFNPLGGRANVTIGDRPGRLEGPPGAPIKLDWLLDDGFVATVNSAATPDSVDIALRVARSVVPDTTAACETSLRFGWLPAGARPGEMRVTVYGWVGQWSQTIDVSNVELGMPGVRAMFGTRIDLVGGPGEGQPATLRGRPGRIRSTGSYGEAVVDLHGGRWLRVLAYTSRDPAELAATALHVADDLHIGPDPYLGWIGHR